jgi:hypothetical protein
MNGRQRQSKADGSVSRFKLHIQSYCCVCLEFPSESQTQINGGDEIIVILIIGENVTAAVGSS